MSVIKVGARCLQCPGPIVELHKASAKASPGDVIEIEATDPGFKKDVVAWCKKTKNELLKLDDFGDHIVAVIRKC
ncbi:MAG TPA: SirA family protein [Clostridia bacterium]|nr:SirA family protein [Clostridia bacterium]